METREHTRIQPNNKPGFSISRIHLFSPLGLSSSSLPRTRMGFDELLGYLVECISYVIIGLVEFRAQILSLSRLGSRGESFKVYFKFSCRYIINCICQKKCSINHSIFHRIISKLYWVYNVNHRIRCHIRFRWMRIRTRMVMKMTVKLHSSLSARMTAVRW